jgi:hypothetical protein
MDHRPKKHFKNSSIGELNAFGTDTVAVFLVNNPIDFGPQFAFHGSLLL